MKYYPIYLILLSAFLIACSKNSQNDNSATKSLFIPSSTIATEVGKLPTETITPTETMSLTSTLMPTMTVGPSLTPLPTMGDVQREETIRELQITNGNCILPCWWSIIPGQTSWVIAEQYLSTFISNDIGQGGRGIVDFNGMDYEATNYTVRFSLSDENESDVLVSVVNGIVWSILTNSGEESSASFTVGHLIDTYGYPSEVWVAVLDRPDNWLIILSLFYPDQGFRASYSQEIESSNEQLIQTCISRSPSLFLYSPDRELKWEDTPGSNFFKSVEEIGIAEIDSLLAETASNPQIPFCLDVPINEFSE